MNSIITNSIETRDWQQSGNVATACSQAAAAPACQCPPFCTPLVKPKSPKLPAWAGVAADIASSWGFSPCLRISVVGGCNADCSFGCHNEGSPRNAAGLTVKQYRSIALASAQTGLHVTKITGGEPCLRPDLPQIVSQFHQAGFTDISLITNGSLLTWQLQRQLKDAGLDRLTVSFHSLDVDRYHRLTRLSADHLTATKTNLESAASIFTGKLKLNSVFVPGMNFPDEVVPLVRYACNIKATLSVLSIVRSGRSGPSLSQAVRHLVDQNFKILRIHTTTKRLVDVNTLVLKEGGAVELDDFRLDQAVAVKNTNAYCAACPLRQTCTEGPYALRVTANGRLKPCLIRRDNEVPITRHWSREHDLYKKV